MNKVQFRIYLGQMITNMVSSIPVFIGGVLVAVALGTQQRPAFDSKGEVWRRNNVNNSITFSVSRPPKKLGFLKIPLPPKKIKTLRQPLQVFAVSESLKNRADEVRSLVELEFKEKLQTRYHYIEIEYVTQIFEYIVKRVLGFYLYLNDPGYFARRPDLVALYTNASGAPKTNKQFFIDLREEFKLLEYRYDFAEDLMILKVAKSRFIDSILPPVEVINYHHIIAACDDRSLEFVPTNIYAVNRAFHAFIHGITFFIEDGPYNVDSHLTGSWPHFRYAYDCYVISGQIYNFNLLNQPEYQQGIPPRVRSISHAANISGPSDPSDTGGAGPSSLNLRPGRIPRSERYGRF